MRKALRTRSELQYEPQQHVAVRTIDISLSGMSLMSAHSLDTGTQCTVVFQIADQGALLTISAAAKVVYNTCQGTDGFRLGIRFTEANALRDRLIDKLR